MITPPTSCNHQPRHHPRFCLECGASLIPQIEARRVQQNIEDIGYAIRLSISSLHAWVNHLLILLAPPSSNVPTPSVEILDMLRRSAYRLPGHHHLLRSVNVASTLKTFSWPRLSYLIARLNGLIRVAEGYSNAQWRNAKDPQIREFGKAREVLLQLKIRVYNEIIHLHRDEVGCLNDPGHVDALIRVGLSPTREYHLDIDFKRCDRFTIRYSDLARRAELLELLGEALPNPNCIPQPNCVTRLARFNPAARPNEAQLEQLRSAASEPTLE